MKHSSSSSTSSHGFLEASSCCREAESLEKFVSFFVVDSTEDYVTAGLLSLPPSLLVAQLYST